MRNFEDVFKGFKILYIFSSLALQHFSEGAFISTVIRFTFIPSWFNVNCITLFDYVVSGPKFALCRKVSENIILIHLIFMLLAVVISCFAYTTLFIQQCCDMVSG